jgi:prevent-host-death family protein
MGRISVSRGIVPLGEFKANAAAYLKQLRETDEPIVITQNGRPAAVLLSPGEYDGLHSTASWNEAVAEGIADIEAGRSVPHEQVAAWLKSVGTGGELDPPQ